MNLSDDTRCVLLGEYIVDHRATVRACAKEFGISKSTVHTEVTTQIGLYGIWNECIKL